jgi:hypothetical protein
MTYTIYFLVLILGIYLGVYLNRWSSKLSLKIEKLKMIKEVNEKYSNILNNINNKKTKFKSRVNNTIYIGTKLPDLGKVEVVYLLDKGDVVVFKDKKCILTSELVDVKILEDISNSINMVHYDEINDVIDIMGMLFSRADFEKTFNLNFEELKNKMNLNMNSTGSDIDKIIEENEFKFDIDSILDKISKVGLENITPEEKSFLDNYNK